MAESGVRVIDVEWGNLTGPFPSDFIGRFLPDYDGEPVRILVKGGYNVPWKGDSAYLEGIIISLISRQNRARRAVDIQFEIEDREAYKMVCDKLQRERMLQYPGFKFELSENAREENAREENADAKESLRDRVLETYKLPIMGRVEITQDGNGEYSAWISDWGIVKSETPKDLEATREVVGNLAYKIAKGRHDYAKARYDEVAEPFSRLDSAFKNGNGSSWLSVFRQPDKTVKKV